MSFLDRIRECNTYDPADYRPFVVDGHRVGRVSHAFARKLEPFADVFIVSEGAVTLNPALGDFEARSAAVDRVLRRLEAEGAVPAWRDEPYPVGTAFTAPPLLQMERAAIPLMGVRAYGVHVNGFVRDGDRLLMWIAQRARDKPTFPGMLDNMVAGGQPIGVSLAENVVKECGEEADIPPPLARRAVPVGAVTYCAAMDGGLKPDAMFCFDLELPPDFTPRNRDGEIAEFHLWPVERVAEVVRTTREFKFNCNLVIIDFLVRHGLIAPDDPDYLDIVTGLRCGAARGDVPGGADTPDGEGP